jgi:hypothetical protein
MLRPNFTDAKLTGKSVRLEGVSDPADLGDIVDIRVFLEQAAGNPGDTPELAHTFVKQLSSNWNATVEGDFRVGQAMAFGVETRSDPVTTITWAEAVDIHN